MAMLWGCFSTLFNCFFVLCSSSSLTFRPSLSVSLCPFLTPYFKVLYVPAGMVIVEKALVSNNYFMRCYSNCIGVKSLASLRMAEVVFEELLC